jgi:hypothetical protein
MGALVSIEMKRNLGINSIYYSLIKKQVRYSTSTDFNKSSETKDDLANKGQNGLNAGKSKQTTAKPASQRIHSIYNSNIG